MDMFFNNLTRIGDDADVRSQEDLANQAYNQYLLSNYYEQDLVGAAVKGTQYPTVLAGSVAGSAPFGNGSVSTYEELAYADITRLKERIRIEPRPYMTIPYLGRGNGDVDIESELRMGGGSTMHELKSDIQMTEQQYNTIDQYPMEDTLRARMMDTRFCIEEDAEKGWVRGGMNSRETYKQNGTYSESYASRF